MPKSRARHSKKKPTAAHRDRGRPVSVDLGYLWRQALQGPIEVRLARTEAELSRFAEWGSMLGLDGPGIASELIRAHRDRVLGAGVVRGNVWRAMARRHVSFESLVMARTAALVALDGDGTVIGGVLAGPDVGLLDAMSQDWDAPAAVTALALVAMWRVDLVAVDEPHRRRGVGSALMRALTATAFYNATGALYGAFAPREPGLSAFFGRPERELFIYPTGAGVDVSVWLGGFPTVVMPEPDRCLFYLNLQPPPTPENPIARIPI
ncbi:GNAT family N-acetyltransferase [Nocardia sp. NPDC058379]